MQKGYLRYFFRNVFETGMNQILNNQIFVRNGAWNAPLWKETVLLELFQEHLVHVLANVLVNKIIINVELHFEQTKLPQL